MPSGSVMLPSIRLGISVNLMEIEAKRKAKDESKWLVMCPGYGQNNKMGWYMIRNEKRSLTQLVEIVSSVCRDEFRRRFPIVVSYSQNMNMHREKVSALATCPSDLLRRVGLTG